MCERNVMWIKDNGVWVARDPTLLGAVSERLYSRAVQLKDKARPGESLIVAVDLDNTIAEYKGWVSNTHFMPPLAGAREMLNILYAAGWTIVVYTCRENRSDVALYLNKWGIPFHAINKDVAYPGLTGCHGTCGRKLFANVYIDDRAVQFDGSWVHTLDRVFNKVEYDVNATR